MKFIPLIMFIRRTFRAGELDRSARPLRSLAERRSGVLPTSVHLRWRSAVRPNTGRKNKMKSLIVMLSFLVLILFGGCEKEIQQTESERIQGI